MERSDWSGIDQSGREVRIGYQTKRFDWSGELSVLIGRAPTNQDAKLVRMLKNQSNRSVLARGDAGLPVSLYNNSVNCMSVCLCVCLSVFSTKRSSSEP